MADRNLTGVAPAFLLSRPVRPPILGGQLHSVGDDAAAPSLQAVSALPTDGGAQADATGAANTALQEKYEAQDAMVTAPPAASAVLDLLRAERVAGEQTADLRADLASARAEAKAERETAAYLRRRLDAANMEIGAFRSQLRQGGALQLVDVKRSKFLPNGSMV